MRDKILLIGSNGMLGQRVVNLLQNYSFHIFCASNEDFNFNSSFSYRQIDISKKEEVNSLFNEVMPDVVINTAAYTNVDKAETERQLAYAVNASAPESLAQAAKNIGAFLVHISTDYVFDGLNGPYSEDDQVNPVGYYGFTKLEGENLIKSTGCEFAIIRTNVLYGTAKHGRPDFVKWAVTSLKENKQIRIVNDQINNPTFLDDLAQAILAITQKRLGGIMNIGGEKFLNRYDFTLRIADYFGLDKSLITPILTAELNQPAKRPLKSGLKIEKAKQLFGYTPHSIEETFELMKIELEI